MTSRHAITACATSTKNGIARTTSAQCATRHITGHCAPTSRQLYQQANLRRIDAAAFQQQYSIIFFSSFFLYPLLSIRTCRLTVWDDNRERQNNEAVPWTLTLVDKTITVRDKQRRDAYYNSQLSFSFNKIITLESKHMVFFMRLGVLSGKHIHK